MAAILGVVGCVPAIGVTEEVQPPLGIASGCAALHAASSQRRELLCPCWTSPWASAGAPYTGVRTQAQGTPRPHSHYSVAGPMLLDLSVRQKSFEWRQNDHHQNFARLLFTLSPTPHRHFEGILFPLHTLKRQNRVEPTILVIPLPMICSSGQV